MLWEKKICIRITTRRLVVGLLVATILANLAIVEAVFGATDFNPTPSPTPLSETGPAGVAINTQTPSAARNDPARRGDTPAPPPSQTASLTFTPAATLTATPTETLSVLPTLDVCTLTSSWPLYTVRPGDTLPSLARASGSSVEALMAANCLKDLQLYPGQVLYLPRLPYTPPTFTATASLTTWPTDTPSVIPTATNTPTVTPPPTATLDVRIGFTQPDATLDTCTTPEIFSVSVTLESAQEIRSVTAFFNFNGVPAGQVDLSPNGAVYSGSAQVGLENYPEIITYSFIAFDSLGNRAESDLYDGTIICSFGLAQ